MIPIILLKQYPHIMETNKEITLPYFDLEEICKFVTYSDQNKTTEIETITNYDIDEFSKYSVNNKSISERTIPSNMQIDTIRYDLVKTLMLKLIDEEIFKNEMEEQTFSFGAQLAITTLKEFKMLKI